MEEEQLKKSRQESHDRLRNATSRAAQSGPLWERLINILPFVSSSFSRSLFRMAGIKVGKGVLFLGKVKVKLRGNPGSIYIGNEVTLGKNADLRNRENGKIILHDRCYLDNNVRIVAARDGMVEIGSGAEIGAGGVINSGGVTKIGEYCMIAVNANINSSSHGIAKGRFIKDQDHEHGYVTIGNDVWFGGNVTVTMNSSIGEGAVIGGNSLIKGDIPSFAICVGSPAKVIKYRN